jgi:hypothetical protein
MRGHDVTLFAPGDRVPTVVWLRPSRAVVPTCASHDVPLVRKRPPSPSDFALIIQVAADVRSFRCLLGAHRRARASSR